MAFNINAAVVLSGPKNIQKVKSSIQSQLSSISANVNVNVGKNASKNIRSISSQVTNLNTNLSRLTATAGTTSSALNGMASTSRAVGTSAAQVSSSAKKVSTSLNQTAKSAKLAGSAVQAFGKDAALAVRRFAAFSIATGAIFGFVRAVTDAVGSAVKFERELVKITQVTGAAGKQLDGLKSTVDGLATSLGLDATKLLDVARTFAQTGQSLNQVESSLKAVARASLAPTFGEIEKTAEGAIAAIAQFRIGADKLEGILGSLNQVSKEFAVESDDLISVIRRAGGVFAASTSQLGGPEERLRELIGVFTAVRSTTRESADTIATGLRTIFTRVQRPQTIKFLEQFGVRLRATAEDAKRLGIAEGEFVGIFEALKKISEASKGLDTLQTARLVEELGGVRQVGKLIPALQNFEKAEKAVQVALKGRTSITKDVGLATQTLSVQLENLSQRFEKLFRDISESGTFQNLAKFAIETANAFITLADALRPILPALTSIAAIRIGAASFGFLKGFAGGIRGGGGAAGVGTGLANIATAGGATGQSQAQQAANQKQSTSALQSNNKLLTTNTSALKALNTSINALQKSSASLNTSAGKLTSQAVTLTSTLQKLPAQIAAASSRGAGIGTAVGRSVRRRAAGGNIPKFADGGFVKGPSHAQGGVVAELEGGELVVPKKQAKLFTGGLPRLKSPGGRTAGQNITVPEATALGLRELYSKDNPTVKKVTVAKVRDNFNSLSAEERKRLLVEAKKVGNPIASEAKLRREIDETLDTNTKRTAGASSKRNAQVVELRLNPSSFAGLFLTTENTAAGGKPFDPASVGTRGQQTSPKAQKLLVEKARKAGFSNASRVFLGGVAQSFISTESKRKSGIDEETKIAAQDAFKAATKAALASPSLQIGEGTPYKVADKAIDQAVEPLFQKDGKKVNSAQGAIQGYLLEGILGAMANIAPQSSDATFDFLFKKGKTPNFQGLADFFDKDVGLFSALTAADAKRAATKPSVQRIYRKSGDYLAVNEFGDDAQFVAAAQGKLIPGDGMTPVRVSNGEGVIAPDVAKGNLADLERARKGDRDAISRIAALPVSRIKGRGTGTSDSIEGELPANSFVLPTSTMKKLSGQQKLAAGGIVGRTIAATKADPTTALFIGLQGSLLAGSKSVDEFKGNLVNTALTLAFLGPQLKQFGAAITGLSTATKDAADKLVTAETRRAAVIAAREKTGQAVVQSAAQRESLALGRGVVAASTAARDFGVGSGKSKIGLASKDTIKEAGGNLRKQAEKRAARANKLIAERNKIVAQANQAFKVQQEFAGRNAAAEKAIVSDRARLQKFIARKVALESRSVNVATGITSLEKASLSLTQQGNDITKTLSLKRDSLLNTLIQQEELEKQLTKSGRGFEVGRQGQAAGRGFSRGQLQQPVIDLANRKAEAAALQKEIEQLTRASAANSKSIALVNKNIQTQTTLYNKLAGQLKTTERGISGFVKRITFNQRTASLTGRTAAGAATTRSALLGRAASLQGGVTAARAASERATNATRVFDVAARAELARRGAGARTARIAQSGALTRAQRIRRVAEIRGARQGVSASQLARTGLQPLGTASKVGLSGAANVGKNIGSAVKAGLGGPAGIAALVASLVGDAVVDGITKAGLGKTTELGGVRGITGTPIGTGKDIAGATGAAKGAISGAALGVSVGLLAGPFAPIAATILGLGGAVAGGIKGFIDGINEQVKFESLLKLDNAARTLTKSFDELAQSNFKNINALENVSTNSDKLGERFNQTQREVNAVEFKGLANNANLVDKTNERFSRLGALFSQESGFFAKSNVFGDALSIATNDLTGLRLPTLLGGRDPAAAQRRVNQRLQGGEQLRRGANIDRSLSLIPDELIQKANEQFAGLTSSLLESIDVSEITGIASLTGSNFDDLFSALQAASDGSEIFEKRLETLKDVATTLSLGAAKDLSNTLNQAASQSSNANRSSAFFAAGKQGASAFTEAIQRGASFEEAGKAAGDKLIKGVLTVGDISASELSKSFGIDSFEDLKKVAEEAGAPLTLLAQRLKVSTQDIITLTGATDEYFEAVTDLNTEQTAAAAKQKIVNDLIRAQSQGLDAFAAALEDLDSRVSNITTDFTTTATNVQSEVARILSTTQEVGAVGRANVFAGGGRGRTGADLDAGVERVRRSIGGEASSFSDLSGTVQLGNRLPQALKDTIDQIEREGGEFSFIDVKNRLIENINRDGNIFDGLSGPVQDQLLTSLEAAFTGQRQSQAIGVEDVLNSLQELGNIQGQFVSLSEQAASTLASVTDSLNQLNSAILQSANLIVEASRQRVDAELNILSRRSSFEDQFGGFQTGGRDPLTKATTRLSDRIATLVKAGGAGTATVGGVNLGGVGGGDLLQRRTGLEDIRRRLLDQIGELTGVDTTSTEDAIQAAQGIEGADQLISELGNTTAALEGTKRAIEEQANETARLTAIESKLASINEARLSERQRGQLLLNQLSSAKTPQDEARILNEFQRPFIAATKLAAGQGLTTQEGAALQSDLLQGNTGIVANAFRQQNPGATEQEVSDFIERSLASFQVGIQNLAGSKGLDPRAVAATLGTAQGPGATARGETEAEKSLLSEAEKIQQEQIALVQGYVEQNTGLLEIQQDVYRQEILKTTAALKEASTSFANLRDTQQQLLETAKARTAQLEAVTAQENVAEGTSKLKELESKEAEARAQSKDAVGSIIQGQNLVGRSISEQGILKNLLSASVSGDAAIAEAEATRKAGRIPEALASQVTRLRFGDDSGNEEALKFEADLAKRIRDVGTGQGSLPEIKRILQEELEGSKEIVTKPFRDAAAATDAQRKKVAELEQTADKAATAQKDLEKKSAEEVKTLEASKKAREEATKQDVATATSPAGIGPAEAAERQRQAEGNRVVDGFIESQKGKNFTGISNVDIVDESTRADAVANAKSENERRIAAARQQDQDAGATTGAAGTRNALREAVGSLGGLGAIAEGAGLDSLGATGDERSAALRSRLPGVLASLEAAQAQNAVQPEPVRIGGGGQFNVRDGVSLANKGRTLEKQTTGSGVSQDDLAAFQEFGQGGVDPRIAGQDFASNTQLQDRQFIGGSPSRGGGPTRSERRSARLSAIRGSLSATQKKAQAARTGTADTSGRLATAQKLLENRKSLLAKAGGALSDEEKARIPELQEKLKKSSALGLDDRNTEQELRKLQSRSRLSSQISSGEKQVAALSAASQVAADGSAGGGRLGKAQALLASRKGLLEKRGGALSEDEKGELNALKSADAANRAAGAGFSIGDENQRRLRSLQERDRLSKDITRGEKQVAALGGGVNNNVGLPRQEAETAIDARNRAQAGQAVQQQIESGTPAPRQDQQTQQQAQQQTRDITGGTQEFTQSLDKFGEVITSSTFAKDILAAADKLSNLKDLNISFQGQVEPIKVILSGGALLKAMNESIKAELVPLIQDAINKQLNNINF